MKNSELIEQLQSYPLDADVYVGDDEYQDTCDTTTLDKHGRIILRNRGNFVCEAYEAGYLDGTGDM